MGGEVSEKIQNVIITVTAPAPGAYGPLEQCSITAAATPVRVSHIFQRLTAQYSEQPLRDLVNLGDEEDPGVDEGEEVGEGVLEGPDPVVVAAVGGGEAEQEVDDLVEAETEGALLEEVLEDEEMVEHQLPFFRLDQEAEVDTVSGGETGVDSFAHLEVESRKEPPHAGVVVEDEAGPLAGQVDPAGV